MTNAAQTVKHQGEIWTIVGRGIERDGKVLCHLKNTTRGFSNRNGFCPVQMCDWIEVASIA